MNLTGQVIRHVNTIAHDGKVLVVGTAADGALYYSVKRSGFEDSALAPAAEPFGFEPWKPLRLGESLEDASVIRDEQERLADPDGNVLVRSVYGADAEATRSAVAPVQLVSLLGHVYVFRQSPGGMLLVNRFVLDGMLNELVPKLDVRFRRSRQRLEPIESVGVEEGAVVDSLDYRDMDGIPFYEPALELGFVGPLEADGWFSVVCVATSESDRGRWHIFTGDAKGVSVTSTGSTSSLPFDVGDHLYAQVSPDGKQTTWRSLPGITRRAIELDGLEVSGRPSATTYDLQTEQLTDAGTQLIRGATRLMLAVPARAPGEETTRTAALSFGIAADGTLARLDETPDAIEPLCGNTEEVLLPLTLLDSIHEVATTAPAPAGTIAGLGRGDEDLLAIRSRDAVQPDLAPGQRVELRGTQSHDGHYVVQSVEGTTFQVEATFERGEPGFWEAVPDKQTGLVFDNMIVGYGKTLEGKLQISCPAHDLKVGDEVQISGTRSYDGTYPVTEVDGALMGFTLDAPFFTGEAANLSKVTRRGLRLDGDDHLETPSLGHEAPSRTAGLARTLSAWVNLDEVATGQAQELVAEAAGLLSLSVGADRVLELRARTSDGTVHTVRDTAAMRTGAWVHVAGTLAYEPSTGGDTRLVLCRDGAEVAEQTIPHAAPCHLRETVLDLSSGDAYCDVTGGAALFKGRFTVACWANVTGGANSARTVMACSGTGSTGFRCRVDAQNRWEVSLGDGAAWATLTGPAVAEQAWTHLAATWDGATLALYVDGVIEGTLAVSGRAPVGVPLRLGAGGTGGSPAEYFPGQLADVRVWSRALAQEELAERMALAPQAQESSLTGYWPLDDGTPQDRSLGKRHGVLVGPATWLTAEFLLPEGDPTLSEVAAAYSMGRGLHGELADVQVWELARSPEEIADSRYLPPTGTEEGLAASYRLGAILYEEPPVVPDFSVHGHDAVVHGDPYAGARRLNRATGSGMKVVAYSSDEVVAVTQRGTYEESFEFRVTSPDEEFDPADADGTGRPLFTFSYWGKASQTSPDRIAVSPGSYQQADFVAVGDGWYRASCRVTVPDGVPLLRAFELSDVRGTWGEEGTPPVTEWTSIDIRKHRLCMMSDVVTREEYTERPALKALPAQPQAVLDELEAVRQAEAEVSRLELTIADLDLRLEVAMNNERYENERDTLVNTTLPGLQAQRSDVKAARDAIVADSFSYYQEIQVCHSGKWLTSGSDHRIYQQDRYSGADVGWQHWKIVPLDGEYFGLALQQNRRYLEVPHNGGSGTHLGTYDSTSQTHMQWKFETAYDNYFLLRNRAQGLVADVQGESLSAGAKVLGHSWKDQFNQWWFRTATTVLTDDAAADIASLDTQLAQLDAQIAATQERIAWLNEALAANEDPAALQSQLDTTRAQLTAARTTLGEADTEFLNPPVRAAAAAMPELATDDRGLVTTGAMLDFVQPVGGVSATESCEGTVQLSYIDHAGRLRLTCYDATADSRNSTYEQWLPDAARACAEVRDAGDAISLAAPITLPASGSTCEAWLRWPSATQADTGSAYGANAVVAGAAATDVPLMIREGNRLGLRVDGWYFDAGIDLYRVATTGWHHVAVSTRGFETGFFIDGVRVGGCQTRRPVLRFDGSASYLEVPAFESPTTAVTVSAWARSAGATWNETSNLVSKRDAFILYPVKGTKKMQFYVWTTSWQSVQYEVPDVRAWHHYTGTYDGHYLRLYVDGVVVAERAVTGAIKADGGVMRIGHDDGQHTVPFAGDIAEVAVWNTARSLDEVSGDLYRSPSGGEYGLVGCWRMERLDHGGEVKIQDVGPHARHALLRGVPQDAPISTQRDRQVAVLGNVVGGGSPIGRLAEVRLWSAPLSDDELAANARVVLTGDEPGLLAYWPLDEGAGLTARDRVADGAADGSLAGADWAGCTANLGNLGGAVLGLPGRGNAHVTCPAVPLANTSFTVELWARRSGANLNATHYVLGQGTKETSKGLHIGFRNTGVFTFAFYNDDLDTSESYTDTDWHHWCCVYDQPTRAQRIYRDGVKVAERTANADYAGTGALWIGRGVIDPSYFLGELSDVRFWNRARTEDELRADLRLRLIGTEPGLLACYPLDTLHTGGYVHDQVSGSATGKLQGTARLLLTTGLPAAGTCDLVTAEYSTVGATPDGTQQAVMRRSLAFVTGGEVGLIPELRIEELLLQWVGNTQILPTLIGYIEGAPPVPSENLTLRDDYRGAATVSLMQSSDTVYTFERSETQGETFETSGFIGGAWDVETGRRVQKVLTQGEVGAIGGYLEEDSELNQSTTQSSSTHTTTDRLTLSGRVEDKAMCAALGPRYVPKNVGYALVVSGIADVFVTKLTRSGRMVGYDIRPLEGVPLDVNTITFLMNPAYVLNGSLDGLVGSSPADPTFYAHVPSMRAQYGSKYPASYFRLEEAYALSEEIERMDKERESFFYNFDASQAESLDTGNRAASRSTETEPEEEQDAETARDRLFAEARQRMTDIAAKYPSLEDRVRASEAFAAWQVSMTKIQTKAGKRNVVNTYIWDGDGGLRAEEQSFANTVEHSLGVTALDTGSAGNRNDVLVAGFKFELSVLGSTSHTDTSGKSLNRSRTLQLSLDLSGIEQRGITDLRDNPLVPGEKVDRYRFMSFYLEGSTDHFHDFFGQVVDPEWLLSNDEEARALRQTQAGKPNRCWRVLHRVTYVERPALMNLGKEAGTAQGTTVGEPTVEERLASLETQVAEQGAKLDEILLLLNSMAQSARAEKTRNSA